MTVRVRPFADADEDAVVALRHAAGRPCDGDDLAVAPDRRGHGLGGTRMAEAEERLLALGCPEVDVQVRSGDEAVAAFSDRLGYARTARPGWASG